MATKRIHLATATGGRLRCRYTARPSIRATFVPLAEFVKLAPELRCSECQSKAVALAMAITDEGGVSQADGGRGLQVSAYV